MMQCGTDIQKETAKRRPRETRPTHPSPAPAPVPLPMVSQETRERLYAEARQHPLYEGMAVVDVRAYIDERLDLFLAGQPWWYGRTAGPDGADAQHHASRQQHQARREKEQHARVLAIKNVPEKGGETVTSGSEERSADLLAAYPKNGRLMDQSGAALLSVKTAAIRLSCSEDAVRTWLRQRKFQRVKVGSSTQIKTQDVDACIRLKLQPQETY